MVRQYIKQKMTYFILLRMVSFLIKENNKNVRQFLHTVVKYQTNNDQAKTFKNLIESGCLLTFGVSPANDLRKLQR